METNYFHVYPNFDPHPQFSSAWNLHCCVWPWWVSVKTQDFTGVHPAGDRHLLGCGNWCLAFLHLLPTSSPTCVTNIWCIHYLLYLIPRAHKKDTNDGGVKFSVICRISSVPIVPPSTLCFKNNRMLKGVKGFAEISSKDGSWYFENGYPLPKRLL